MSASSSRLSFVDVLKAVASQLIVLHHLAFYGPMSDAAAELMPALMSWLSRDARIAVQAFLVIGGFLAAQSLAPRGELLSGSPLALVRRRYLILVLPYLAALALSIVGAALARLWMTHESIPAAPTMLQLAAHTLLLQDILDFEALSAGIWYVAIDFQLFTLFLATLWLSRGIGTWAPAGLRLGPLLVAGLGVASLFHFNRDAEWDAWALYFFGSYALGVLSYWGSQAGRSPAWPGAIAAVATAALLIDFRSRIAVALGVALALGFAHRAGIPAGWPKMPAFAFLGKISYSLFLVHFPVCLVVNALFTWLAPGHPVINAIGMLLAWAASIATAALFFLFVEKPARGWAG